MAIQYKSTKPKKEKPVKIKPEKPAKIKQESSIKIKKEKSVKIKREKPVKIKQDKSTPIGKGGILSSSPKIEKKKSSIAIDGINDNKKKSKNIKVVIIAAVVILVLALIASGIMMYVKYAKEVEADGKNIDSIYVSAYPTHTTYHIGDTRPDYTGLKLGILLKNGTNQYVEYSEENAQEFIFKGFDSSAYSEQQAITVIYKGYECTFNISIEEKQAEVPILSKISLETLPQTEYEEGEWLNTRGGVILLEYTNHTPKRVNLTNQNIDELSWQMAYDSGVGGPYEIIVFYVDWNTGIEKETKYYITINPSEEALESSEQE